MKVALCAIAKNEDKYVDFWVHHYLDRGFDHITIYDNNDEKDLTCNYPCKIERVHGKEQYQLQAYKEFFEKEKDNYDWIFYFDLDEYLDCDNIKVFLESLDKNVNQVQFKLMNMSDNNRIISDYTKSPFELFTEPSAFQSYYVKSGVSTKARDSIIFKSCHVFILDFSHTVLSGGEPRQDLLNRFATGTSFRKEDFEKGPLMHHIDAKTIQEYIDFKFNRTDARFKDPWVLAKVIPDRCFFKQCKKTKEKLEILSKAPFNNVEDVFLNEKDFSEELLNTYRKVYKERVEKNVWSLAKHMNLLNIFY